MDFRLVWVSAFGALALIAPAAAHTVNCNLDADRLQDAVSRLSPHSTVTLEGNCVGNITIATDGLSFVAVAGGASITGQVEVTARRVSFSGISIVGPEPSDPNTIVRAGLFAHDGGSVTFANGAIANHTRSGILANRGASVIVMASQITGNGTARVPNDADGVQAIDAGSVLLGGVDANNDPIAEAGDEIAGNAARGILTARGGAIRILAGNVHDNGLQAALAAFSGSIGINGGTFSVPTPSVGIASDVITATLGGTIDIQNASGNGVGTITGTTTVTGSAGGVVASDSGTVRLRSVTVTTSGGRNVDPAVGAFRGASVHLEGANTIRNTNTQNAGFALNVADSAVLRLDDATGFPSAPNQISGAIGVFDLSSMRIADFNPASSIAGSFTVSINGLLVLQRANIVSGDISVFGPSTLNAAPGPIGFNGTLHCFNSPNVILSAPNPFSNGAVCQ